MPCVAALPPTPILSWREIGRPGPMDAPNWTTWAGSMGRQHLYRSLVIEGGIISVVVDLDPGHGFGPRAIHRGRCRQPGTAAEVAECIQSLLEEADRAVARFIERAACKGTSANDNRLIDTPGEAHQSPGAWQDRAAALWPEAEHRIRERAYFLWEQAGRPAGGAEDFWVRACHEEAQLVA